MTWQVSWVTGHDAYRRETVRGVVADQLAAAISVALGQGAVLVEREGLPPETWLYRVSQLVDTMEGVDKNGKPYTRRSVRYGKINGKKMKMEDWDRIVRLSRVKKRTAEPEEKWPSHCVNGDKVCACMVLKTTCRREA